MIRLTDKVRETIKTYLEDDNNQLFRIAITGFDPHSFRYAFSVDSKEFITPTDKVIDCDGVPVVIDEASAAKLYGATIDFGMTPKGPDFLVDNPNKPEVNWPTTHLQSDLAKEIHALIENEVNPAVASHGGVVELLDVKENRVFVKLGGGCQGCGMSQVTLKQGIETMIKQAFPQITEVIDTTDHAAGTNPFFSPR